MRILSLIPSATEIVYALGLGDDLVGVTEECDFPPEVRAKPSVSAPVVAASPAGEIDATVKEAVAAGRALYDLDTDLVRDLRPDLILAQDICRVCAVPSGDVEQALALLGTTAEVLSLDPRDLDGVLESIRAVAAHAGAGAAGDALVDSLAGRLGAVSAAVEDADGMPRTVCVEWPDPIFVGGNWVPDMVTAAGGVPVVARSGEPSFEMKWEELLAGGPEVIMHMPCGYDLAGSIAQSASLVDRLERDGCQLWAVDSTAYFSRPGPRLVDGIEILAHILHPDAVPPPPAGRAERLR
jgi:iron complex transport system substrate-binding protein